MRARFMFALIILQVACVCFAGEIVTKSPDGRIVFTVKCKTEEGVYFDILVGKELVLGNCPISLIVEGDNCCNGSAGRIISRETIDRTVVPTISTVRAKIKERCNETVVAFGDELSMRIRCFDDGAAYRFESGFDQKNITVNSESLSLKFTKDYKIYYPVPNGEGYFSHQECEFLFKKISEISSTQKAACLPALVEIDGRDYMLVTDVNVEGYPGMWLKSGIGTSIEAVFPKYPAETKLIGDRGLGVSKRCNFLAKTDGKRSFPWRAFVIAKPERLLNSTMLYTLADSCRVKDTSWIKPGKVAWDWWNAWNITDVPFKAGINQVTYKNYIDFAAANKLDYIILDEGWSVKGPDNLLKVVETLDIGELVRYGESKGVGVILWMTSVALERSYDKAFEQFDEWGIKGLKVDFMQRDDQVMMDFCAKVAADAAKHKLIVDFHGGSKPTGLQRTYPNVLTHESVLGLEQSKWSRKASPDMAVLLPFIRMVAGPMDYTPGAMDNFNTASFRQSFNNPASLGTRCHQLAMYVVFLSPLQMLADTPTKYRRNPESMEFLSLVPTTWDETVVLKADVGDVVAVARRKGKKWFVGALTDWNGRRIKVSLDFLAAGEYKLTYWADGPEAVKKATDTAKGEKTVTAGTKLEISMSPGGGYAAVIEPK